MSEASRKVRLDLRHVTLSETAELSPAGDTIFVALDEPPPVRTLLRVVEEGAKPRVLEVTRVIEAPDADGRNARGLYGRFVDDAAGARLERVGTEHIAAGEGGEAHGSPSQDGSDGDDGGRAQMAMPAPVVDPDPSEPIDLDEVRRLEGADHDADEDGDASSDRDDAGGDEDGESSDDNGQKKTRRRKGRKRR